MAEVIICNKCGKKIVKENGLLKEDVFEGKKQWGYFSEKDRELHEFYLCEDCYDRMISEFKVPVKITEVTEL